MKVTIKEAEKKTPLRQYPYIGISDELIVLFVKDSEGLILKNDSCFKEGSFEAHWNEKEFKPFEGEIILSNE